MPLFRFFLYSLVLFFLCAEWGWGADRMQDNKHKLVRLAVDATNLGVSKPLTKKKNKKPIASKYSTNRKKLLQQEPMQTQRAWLYSAILPGLGQVYNRQYWKVGVFYGGFALGTVLAIFHHQEYRNSKRACIELEGKTQRNTSLENYMASHKRERDMYLFLTALWYIINIFDAYVDGTLKTFDVSDNLEIIFEPAITAKEPLTPTLGIGVSLNLKP